MTSKTANPLLVNVNTQRHKLHKATGAGLVAVLGGFAADVNVGDVRNAVDPDADKNTRRAQAQADLQRQAILTGVTTAWMVSNRTAHVASLAAGQAAAGHVLTNGTLPAHPTPPVDTGDGVAAFIPDAWMPQQLRAMAGDVAAALADAELTDVELADLIGSDPGALYYLDLFTSQDFMDATNAVYSLSGVETVDWNTMVDERVCDDCDENAARGPYLLGDVPEVPHGLCFPAGTVVSGSPVQGSTMRWHAGEVVEVETIDGYHLTATPNHPVLTTNGWKPLGSLHEGDNLVRHIDPQAFVRRYPDDHQVPALIEDVAQAVGVADNMLPARVPVAAEDFHGDGAYSKVSVVRANSLLLNNIHSPVSQPFSQLGFGGLDLGQVTLPGLRDTTLPLKRMGQSSQRFMSSRNVGSVLLRRACGHHETVSVTAPAAFDAELLKSALNGRTVHSVPRRESVLTLPRLVSGDQLVQRDRSGESRRGSKGNPGVAKNPAGDLLADAKIAGDILNGRTGHVVIDGVRNVSRREFRGHVYNLQTMDGWYVADNFIVHNCRCWIVPSA